MSTATHLDPRRPERTEQAPPALDESARTAPTTRVPRRAWRIVVLVAPGLWVVSVVALSLALQLGVQLTPLLAAAPAIACAGTGRRQCIILGCACALLALVPFRPEADEFGERIGTAPTILIVTFASYLIAQRRQRTQRAYDEVRQIAEVTQRVLLRPVPARIGSVATAVEYLSAASGAQVGGDFYEVIETPYGVRAILGDMRGSGLDAVGGAAALLGAFREAGAIEPVLEAVAVRLDAALARRASELRRAALARIPEQQTPGSTAPGTAGPEWHGADRPGDGDTRAEPWVEDFATAVLVQIPFRGTAKNAGVTGSVAAGTADGDDTPAAWHGLGSDQATLVLCGHPAPILMHGNDARQVETASSSLPLGLGSLAAEPYAPSSITVPFGSGDTLVLYTDGVSEARARDGDFFPLDSLVRGLSSLSPDAIAGFLRGRLLDHMRGGLHDDAALLVLRSQD